VDREIAMIAIVLNTLFIAGGVAIILMAMYQRGRTREMQHRERLAMIERGLAPPPERDPASFDPPRRAGHPPATGIGVVIVALGLGLMLLIAFTARAEDVAVGIGGAIVVLGAAFIVIGELQRRAQPPVPASAARSIPVPPPPPSSGEHHAP
jgi:hypothetical protein